MPHETPLSAGALVLPPPGRAGGSAIREYDRRSARELTRKLAVVATDREDRQRMVDKHPVLGRLASALTPKAPVGQESQATRAWKQGYAGERLVGEILEGVDGIALLHDRRVPGSRGNIDHVVVGPSGVFVVDPKNYAGKVEKRDKGGLLRLDERLFVGGRDRTRLVHGVLRQTTVVRDVLRRRSCMVPVHGVLCFVGKRPSLSRRHVRVAGVTVLRPKALPDLVTASGPVDPGQIAHIARLLAQRLPPA